jgi:hypothetical protein
MKKLMILFIALLYVQLNVFAQADTLISLDNVYQQSQAMNKAFLAGDYDRFLDLIHPKIVELTGGRDKMKVVLKQGFGSNFELISNESQKPDRLIISDSTMQCVLQQRMEFKMDGESYFTISSLIGISYDSGQTWKFIGVAGNTLGNIKTFIPELSDGLKVRSQSKPVLIR